MSNNYIIKLMERIIRVASLRVCLILDTIIFWLGVIVKMIDFYLLTNLGMTTNPSLVLYTLQSLDPSKVQRMLTFGRGHALITVRLKFSFSFFSPPPVFLYIIPPNIPCPPAFTHLNLWLRLTLQYFFFPIIYSLIYIYIYIWKRIREKKESLVERSSTVPPPFH